MREKQRDKNEPTPPVFSRRNFLRLAAGAAGGALLFHGGKKAVEQTAHRPAVKVSVNADCVACTGCVSTCPKNAIAVVPQGIVITDELCIRCGYCAAACPVQALKVNRA